MDTKCGTTSHDFLIDSIDKHYTQSESISAFYYGVQFYRKKKSEFSDINHDLIVSEKSPVIGLLRQLTILKIWAY